MKPFFLSVPIAIHLLVFTSIVYGKLGNETWKLSKPWIWSSPPSGTTSMINNLKDMWEPLEEHLESNCEVFANSSLIIGPVFVGNKTPLPSICSNIAMCSEIRCILLDRLAWMFSYTTDVSAKLETAGMQNIKVKSFHYRIRSSYWEYLNASSWKEESFHNQTLNLTTVFDSVSLYSDVDVKRLPRLSERLNRTFDTECRNAWAITDMVIKLEEEFSVGCAKLMLCNGTFCFLTSLTSIQLSTVVNQVTHTVENTPQDLPYCSSIGRLPQIRHRRHTIPAHNQTEPNKNSGSLSFNLPGYRYCGPDTVICTADANGGPVNELDAACRQHDIDYINGVSPEIADRDFLQAVLQSDTPFYLAFTAMFEAKRYFEKVFGTYYTSWLYFSEKSAPSMVNYFYFSSVYVKLNMSNVNEVNYKLGKIKEERWTNIVHDIWRGSCYVQKYSPPGVNQHVSLSESANVLTNPDTGTQTSEQQFGQSSNCEPQSQPKNDITYPVAPFYLKDCRIVISEIATGNVANNGFSFVELTKVCSTKERNQQTSLRNYQLMLLEAGSPPKLHMQIFLSNYRMAVVPETKGKEKNNYYLVIGANGMPESDATIPNYSSTMIEFPDGSTSTFAVLLLYVPLAVPMLPKLPRNPVVPHELQEDEINALADFIQDVVVYGVPCVLDHCNTFRTWLRDQNGLVDVELVPIPEVSPDEDGNKPYFSLSRCSQSHFPMQNNDWDQSQPTPKQKNACVGLQNYPYSMRGFTLKASAQKLVINVHHFFTVLEEEPDLLTYSSNINERTAMATGLHPKVVIKLMNKHEIGNVQTPLNRKRCRRTNVLDTFDKFDIDVIKNIIQGFYQRNEPPLFDDIYTRSMTALQKNTSAPGELVKNRCSTKTFRKLLKKMGFKYGKIDTRVVILQRQDIVAKRWKYLEIIRRNDAGDKLPVVYTDETWLDPNARTGKAWVPRPGAVPFSDMKLYSYRKHKVSRGQRLIVLHAAGPDGLIHEVMQVYPVGGNNAAADYHDNVSSEVYIDWITKLFKILQEKGPHLIVIDNAPYHSKSDAPKSRDTKAVYLKWLTENDPNGTHTGFQQGHRYLKPELWEKVKVLKGIVEHYTIDKLAEQYGHKIVRLPPYNCDLNPIEELWHDLKDDVRKHNTEQNITEVKRLAEQYLLLYTAQQFQAHIRHIKRLEIQYWENDGFYDRMLDTIDKQNQIIIPIRDDDDVRDDDDEDDGNENRDEDVPFQSLSLEHDGERIFFDDDGELLDIDESDGAPPASRRRLVMCD